jgi:glycosyltransferase involved in cell wall biosynthesis
MAKCRRLLAVSREPAPYNVDLWNAFAECADWDLFVLYTMSRDWSPEAGHDFRELPESHFSYTVIHRIGLTSYLVAAARLIRIFFALKPDLVIVGGYTGPLHLLAIFLSALARRPYALSADQFNTDRPTRGGLMALAAREMLRRVVFRTASLVLTCGREGYASAIRAGCPAHKIIDFPYVVEAERLATGEPEAIPDVCAQDIDSGKLILLFSGRLIPRKGFETLLEAVTLLGKQENWVLWIEGDGPMRRQYQGMGSRLGIADRCRFLGFCQMRLHGWILRHADIVIVPSLYDPWGIVADEGMQMGKAVIASAATGSAIDRITHRKNGLLFAPSDALELSQFLGLLLSDPDLRRTLGDAARVSAKQWTPTRNVETLRRAAERLDQRTRE